MSEEFSELLRSVVVLFVVIDPLGSVPFIIGLTKGMEKEQRKNVFRTAVITSLILLMVFALLGHQILLLFGISLNSLMIAGGILLLIMAMRILLYGEVAEKDASTKSAGVIPIAFPLLAGPGAITTTIVSFEKWGILITLFSVAVTFILTWIIMRLVEPIYRILGETGATVVSRVMAIFLAAIAIQFMTEGLQLRL
jgi:multiple antibiotic resistance protein